MNRRWLFVSMIVLVIAVFSFSAAVYAEPLPPGTHNTPETTFAVNPPPVAAPRENPLETVASSTPSIPEPATAILVGITLLGAGTMVRRRKAEA